VAGAEQTE